MPLKRLKISVSSRWIPALAGGVFLLSPSVFRFFLFAACLCAGEVTALADVKRPAEDGPRRAPPVPVAWPVQADAVRGIPVEITLGGLTSTTKTLQFQIRRQPKIGKLEGDPVSKGRGKAVIRYIPDPAATGSVDTFTYAVKVEGTSSSQEAEVKISIVDPEPILESTTGVDLGFILAGVPVERKWEIRNRGNAAFKAAVPLPEGWIWIHPAQGNFNIPPGGYIEAAVNVKAPKAGTIDEKVVLRATTIVRFVGNAMPPVQGSPNQLRMPWDPVKHSRMGDLTVRNNAAAAVTVRFSGPAELTVPGEVSIPAQEQVKVSLAWTGSLEKPAAGTLRLEIPGWSQEVAFDAGPAPPVVSIAGATREGVLDFGDLDLAGIRSASKTLTFSNSGGQGAIITWNAPKSFDVSGATAGAELPPGKALTLTVKPKPDSAGSVKEEWTVGATGGEFPLKLQAELDPEAVRKALMAPEALLPIPADGSSPTARPLNIDETLTLFGGALPVDGSKLDDSLPKVPLESVRVVMEEPERLVIQWDAPAPGTWTYRVMALRLRQGNFGGMSVPVKGFYVMDNIKVTTTPTGGQAEVTKLIPNASWSCIITAIRNDGVETLPTRQLTFHTPAVPPRRWPWYAGGAVLVGWVIYWLRRKWREDIKWQA